MNCAIKLIYYFRVGENEPIRQVHMRLITVEKFRMEYIIIHASNSPNSLL